MAIITISRNSYSMGTAVAEKVAQELGYECISREVLLEASVKFDIPEEDLRHALQDPPNIFQSFSHSKERYVAYVRAAFLRHVQRDNVIYHGLAGHFFLTGISHVLKVRLIAETTERVRAAAEQNHLSERAARSAVRKKDSQRRKWSQHLYGIDTSDPHLYALVIRVKKMNAETAAKLICHTAREDCFQATEESRQKLEELAMAAEIKANLVDWR